MEYLFIKQSFPLIFDINLKIILNDPEILGNIKELIIKLYTDKAYIEKLGNNIQKNDVGYEYKKAYKRDTKDLFTFLDILISTHKIRNMEYKRFIKYQTYLKTVFKPISAK